MDFRSSGEFEHEPPRLRGTLSGCAWMSPCARRLLSSASAPISPSPHTENLTSGSGSGSPFALEFSQVDLLWVFVAPRVLLLLFALLKI